MNEKAVDLALKVAQVTRERDEARAEVERLRARVVELERALGKASA